MRELSKPLLMLAIVALLAATVAACGGGGSTASSTASTSARGTATTPATSPSGSGSSSPSREASASFRTTGGDNSIQNFGTEAGAAEVEAATAVLEGYLRARAKDEWATECSYLAKMAVAPLEQLASGAPQLKSSGCGEILAALEGRAPASTRANTLTGPIASLRVEGDRGFALYHGAHGVDYFVPMIREGGKWKVGSLVPDEFP
jgi:hypothetical protein